MGWLSRPYHLGVEKEQLWPLWFHRDASLCFVVLLHRIFADLSGQLWQYEILHCFAVEQILLCFGTPPLFVSVADRTLFFRRAKADAFWYKMYVRDFCWTLRSWSLARWSNETLYFFSFFIKACVIVWSFLLECHLSILGTGDTTESKHCK